MRIALCLSGQPRTWRHTWRTAFAFFEDHEVDVFIHTWDETESSELQDLLAAYSPRAFRVEARPLFIAEKRRLAEMFPVSPPFTIFDMFHSMSASVALALAANDADGAYDVICRSRFDLIHDGRWNGARPSANTVVVSSAEAMENACNDQFAIGDPAAMRHYAGISSWLMDGLRDFRGSMFRPEIALQHYLTRICALSVVRRSLAVTLLRQDQVERPFADLRDDPMFHALKREDWEAFAKTHDLRGADRELDFQHFGRTPLALDRWLLGLSSARRQAVLTPAELRRPRLVGEWSRHAAGAAVGSGRCKSRRAGRQGPYRPAQSVGRAEVRPAVRAARLPGMARRMSQAEAPLSASPHPDSETQQA